MCSTYVQVLNNRKKMKAERSRLLPRKHTENPVLLSVV